MSGNFGIFFFLNLFLSFFFYLRSFAFEGMRLDESLRLFLETFRLPGEAPLISLVLEHFAEHWRVSTILIIKINNKKLMQTKI